MNVKELSERFWIDGYLVIEDYFEEQLMDSLNDSILQRYGLDPEWQHNDEFLAKTETEVIPWFPFREGNIDFQPIEKDERLKALTHAILGSGWRQLYLMVMFSKQGTKGQAWHQDCPPEDKEHFNLNRLFYTHDITDITGGKTIVVPGSHRLSAISVGDPHENMPEQVIIAPKKGSLVIIHGHTWHRVMPITGAYRVSVNTRAVPKDTSEDITDIAVYRNLRYKFSTNEVVEERISSEWG